MQSSDGSTISDARIGMIPYLVVWAILLYVVLAFQVGGTCALSDNDRQVIAYHCGNPSRIQAYDTGEQNHCITLV
jgi:hypothetical protein